MPNTDTTVAANPPSAVGMGVDAIVAPGTSGQVIKHDGTDWVPGTVAGTGDFVGPAGATDGHMVVFDGVTGKLGKDGGAPGGGGGAPVDAQYVTLAVNGTLTVERVLTAGAGVTLIDAGAGSTLTVKADTYTAVATQTLAAGDAITATDGSPYRPVDSAGAITLTAQPTIAAGRNGQAVLVKNVGAYNIILQDVNALGGSLLRLTANTLTIQPGGTMELVYDSTIGFWIEQYLLNPQTFTPSISSFTCDLSSTQEVAGSGTHAATFTMTLAYVGTPSACSIDISTDDTGGSWPIAVPSPYTSLSPGTTPPCAVFDKQTSVAATRVFTATATVAGTGGLTRTLTFTYYNRRYAGPSTETATLTSGQVLGLDGAGGTSGLSNSRTGTFSNLTIGASEYLWYAYRAALGTGGLYLSIAGEIAGFTEKQTALSHTNDSGFVEDFATWRSDNANLGSGITAVVATSAPDNRIYMGPSTDTDPISNANILALDDTADGESIVSSTIARTYTTIKIEAGEYLWFCHPDRIADLATIKDGTTGFAIAGSYRTNATHTNQYGYAETYRCWRSDNTGIYPAGENVVVT